AAKEGCGMTHRDPRTLALAGLEIVAAVALATLGVAVLQSTAPAAGLGILYLLAVLAVAIRRGQLAALLTAALGVLTFNYFFITPRHRFAIAHSRDGVELVVLLIAAIVVGRLAALGRQRAGEAGRRAEIAPARDDVAVQRHRAAEQAPETEAGRRADVANTPVRHAISHDLRSPPTAIGPAGAPRRAAPAAEDEGPELLDVIDTDSARLPKLADDPL